MNYSQLAAQYLNSQKQSGNSGSGGGGGVYSLDTKSSADASGRTGDFIVNSGGGKNQPVIIIGILAAVVILALLSRGRK